MSASASAMGPDDLIGSARHVLSVVEQAAVEAGFTLPARRYVTVGGSVYDCEQVTVSVMSAASGVAGSALPGQTTPGCTQIWNATYIAAIVVCAVEANSGPRGNIIPSVERVEEDTARMSAAFAVLTDAIQRLTETALGAYSVTFQFGQPQGGLIAAQATLSGNLI